MIPAVLSLLLACTTTIRPGEVGVRQSFGKLNDRGRGPGLVLHGPIGVKIVRVPVRTSNVEVELALPSQEGLNVLATVSILYRIEPDKVPQLLETVGKVYETELVLPVFRSAAADVSSKYNAKDMHSGQRSTIEAEIRERMANVLTPRGVEVESVLLKNITLPAGLYSAVEDKLEAEQRSERMQWVLAQERQEADRRRVEAEGIRDAQRILEEGLTPGVLQWRSLEAFMELAKSPNTKVIVTDGSLPMLIEGE